MDYKFPFNENVEKAQEKILQAQSAQEIKDLLKQDDPQKPNYQEGLIRLISQHIMKQYTSEEINRIEKLPPNQHKPNSNARAFEIRNLKTDDSLTRSVLLDVADKHSIVENYPHLREPEKSVSFSVLNSVLDHIKYYPDSIENIYNDILPEIKHDRNVEQAQEKILNTKSSQEIKELLKQDDPVKPVAKEALVRLVSQNIMKQFTSEEINRIENKPNNVRADEIRKLALKTDDSLTKEVLFETADKHSIVKNNPNLKKPETSITSSIQSVLSDTIHYSIEEVYNNVLPKIKQEKNLEQQTSVEKQIEVARKTGYVQGVCECVAAIGDDHALGKKLLTEMNVNRDMAKKFANPETFKQLEQGIFAQTQEQKREQTQSVNW